MIKIEDSCVAVYVDFQEDNAPIQISIRSTSAATTSHKWNIGLTQIECSSSERGWYSDKEQC